MLGPAQGVGTITLRPQPHSLDSLIDWPRILACAQMLRRINTTSEDKVLDVATSEFQPGKQTCTRVCSNLEMNGATCLVLRDCRSCPDFWTTDQIADLQLDENTATQLAINRQVKQCAISNTFFAI